MGQAKKKLDMDFEIECACEFDEPEEYHEEVRECTLCYCTIEDGEDCRKTAQGGYICSECLEHSYARSLDQ